MSDTSYDHPYLWGSTGCLLIGPIEPLQQLREKMTTCLNERWEKAQPLFPETREKVVDIYRDRRTLWESGKRLLNRKQRDDLLANDDYLLWIEHSHYAVASFEQEPSSEIVSDLLDDIKERARWQLCGTPCEHLAETDQIAVSPILQKAFEVARECIASRSDIGYIVGVEPLSMKSLICGYSKPGLCLFSGVAQNTKTYLKGAKQELKEEGCLELGHIFSEEVQKQIRESLQLQALPYWLNPFERGNGRVYLVVIDKSVVDHCALLPASKEQWPTISALSHVGAAEGQAAALVDADATRVEGCWNRSPVVTEGQAAALVDAGATRVEGVATGRAAEFWRRGRGRGGSSPLSGRSTSMKKKGPTQREPLHTPSGGLNSQPKWRRKGGGAEMVKQ